MALKTKDLVVGDVLDYIEWEGEDFGASYAITMIRSTEHGLVVSAKNTQTQEDVTFWDKSLDNMLARQIYTVRVRSEETTISKNFPYTWAWQPPLGFTNGSTPVSPKHYSLDGDKQAWDVMRDLVSSESYEGYLTLNVVKYLVRHRKKNGKEDLLKARTYIDKLLEVCYEGGSSGRKPG